MNTLAARLTTAKAVLAARLDTDPESGAEALEYAGMAAGGLIIAGVIVAGVKAVAPSILAAIQVPGF